MQTQNPAPQTEHIKSPAETSAELPSARRSSVSFLEEAADVGVAHVGVRPHVHDVLKKYTHTRTHFRHTVRWLDVCVAYEVVPDDPSVRLLCAQPSRHH